MDSAAVLSLNFVLNDVSKSEELFELGIGESPRHVIDLGQLIFQRLDGLKSACGLRADLLATMTRCSSVLHLISEQIVTLQARSALVENSLRARWS